MKKRHAVAQPRRRTTGEHGVQRYRPQVERLEGREMPATLIGLGTGANTNQIFRFDSASPGNTTQIVVTGLGASTLVGFDFRPRTGQLIGLGVNGNTTTLFNINALTGVASVIGSATVNTITGATSFGVDFNPTVDRLRVVNNLASDGAGGNANNFRLNPNDGSLVAIDPDLDFTGVGAGAAPEVAVAYTNNFDNPGGATTLFGITSGEANDRLVINGGAAPGFATLQNVGLLGVDTSNNVGFAIAGRTNTALAILEVANVSGLYSINLTSGAASALGTVGNGTVDFASLAIVPESFYAVGNDTNAASQAIYRNAQTGQTLLNLQPFPGFKVGSRVALGDINRDGMPDLVVGAGSGGVPRIKVFDGATGALIRNFLAYGSGYTGGIFVAVGDVNRDGFGDIIVSAGTTQKNVKAFSGLNNNLLLTFLALNGTAGVRVGSFDINNDGFDEIIAAKAGGVSRVRIFSFATGQVLQIPGPLGNFLAYDPSQTSGIFVAGGDVNGDGIPDVITGLGQNTRVKAFSGVNGVLLSSFLAYPGFSGGVRVGVSDVNADGRYEILTTPGAGRAATVLAFDGVTGLQVPIAPLTLGNTGLFVGGARF